MAAADEPQKKSTAREYYEALLIAIIFVNFARIFVFQAFKIPTGSMEDNLKIGDHIIVNKFIYGPAFASPLAKLFPLRDVQRGDIIVFRFPENPEIDYVKRVIGPNWSRTRYDPSIGSSGRVCGSSKTTYGSSSCLPLMETFLSRIVTTSPGRPITRFT